MRDPDSRNESLHVDYLMVHSRALRPVNSPPSWLSSIQKPVPRIAVNLFFFSLLTLPLVATAGHESASTPALKVSAPTETFSPDGLSPKIEWSERQVDELINSNIQSQQRTRLRAYEIAGVTAFTGGIMLVGAIAGGPATALAAGIGALTIYVVLD